MIATRLLSFTCLALFAATPAIAAEPVSVSNLPSWQELIDGLHRP